MVVNYWSGIEIKYVLIKILNQSNLPFTLFVVHSVAMAVNLKNSDLV